MYDETEVRSLLIDSCHSSKDAQAYFDSRLSDPDLLDVLMTIATDTEDHGGDAPMQAAYYASKFSGLLLAPYEQLLITLLPHVNGFAGHVALALGKTRSTEGRDLILQALGDGSRYDAWLFHNALAEYER